MKKTKSILSGAERGFFQGCLVLLAIFVLNLNFTTLIADGLLVYTIIVDIAFVLFISAYVALSVGKIRSDMFKKIMIISSVLAVGYTIYSFYFPWISLLFFT